MLIFLLNPSFPSPFSTPVAGSGAAPTLVPFYLRRVSTPSASLSESPRASPTPARRNPLSAPPLPFLHPPCASFALFPLPGTNRSRPIPVSARAPLPSAKHHGSHGGSYGINKSGAHAPQLPSLLPSAATSHPPWFLLSSVRRLRHHRRPPPLQTLCHPPPPSFFVAALPFTVPRSPVSSPVKPPASPTRARIPPATSMDFVLLPPISLRLQIVPTSSPFPIP